MSFLWHTPAIASLLLLTFPIQLSTILSKIKLRSMLGIVFCRIISSEKIGGDRAAFNALLAIRILS